MQIHKQRQKINERGHRQNRDRNRKSSILGMRPEIAK